MTPIYGMIKSCRRQQMSVGRYDHRRERSDQMWSCLCKEPHKQRRAVGTRPSPTGQRQCRQHQQVKVKVKVKVKTWVAYLWHAIAGGISIPAPAGCRFAP